MALYHEELALQDGSETLQFQTRRTSEFEINGGGEEQKMLQKKD